MSEILDRLAESDDELENDLAAVLRHWQEMKQQSGRRRDLGYEPRDIAALGAKEVITRRVLKGSAGFEEVDPRMSYEAIVLRHRHEFSPQVVSAAQLRVKRGANAAREFRVQEIQFLIKTSSKELFGERDVEVSEEAWNTRTANVPAFTSEFDFVNPMLANGFRCFVWLHERERDGERGNGLTGVIELGPPDEQRKAKIRDTFLFPVSIGSDILERHRNSDDLLGKIRGFNHTRIWPITSDTISTLLTELQKKSELIDDLNGVQVSPGDPEMTETEEEVTALRAVVIRQFQAAFRKTLLSLREKVCAITGTDEVAVLEAAHIVPYAARFSDRNRPENGLLLRRDIHRLFDMGLISIDPENRKVCISQSLQSDEYRRLEGKRVADAVSDRNLSHHFREVFLGS